MVSQKPGEIWSAHMVDNLLVVSIRIGNHVDKDRGSTMWLSP